MSAFKLSRRQFLIGITLPVVSVVPVLSAQVSGIKGSDDSLKMLKPGKNQTLDTFLTATIEWQYPIREKVLIDHTQYFWWNYRSVTLTVFSQEGRQPIVNVELPNDQTFWRFAVLPAHKYFWQLSASSKGWHVQWELVPPGQ